MEVLVISHKYPPSIGGMQTHCYKLVQELEKRSTVHPLIWKSNYPRGLFFLTVVFRAWLKLRKNKNIRVIYINDGLMALVCTPLLFLTKVPMTVTIHGLDVNFPSGLYQWWVRKFLNRFDKIIAVSEPTAALCLEKGLKPERVVKVENAVDIHFTNVAEDPDFRQTLSTELGVDLTDKFIITSLGRAIPRKGFNWFTRNVYPQLPENVVYFIIARKFQQASLFKWIGRLTTKNVFEKIRLLVGAETDDLAVDESIAELKLQNKVFHLSQYTDSRTRIFEIIRHSDLFVMPNIQIKGDYEGFGLVALEAASQGTLTLAANVDGIPSAVKDDENGMLLPQGDAQAWAERIAYLVTHPDQLQEKADRYKQNTLTQGRSWGTMTENYLQVFRELSKN